MNIFKKNQKGFSLVEVMVAAGIMGVLSVFFYKSFADQIKQQKTAMQRMEESNVLAEVRMLLMNQKNCSETLKDQILTLDLKGDDKLEKPIDDLKKVYTVQVEGEAEPKKEVVSKYLKWISEKQENKYGQNNLKINDYYLTFSKNDSELFKTFNRGEVTFVISFDRGLGKFGSRIKPYKIPLEVEVDDARKLISCSSMGLPAGGQAGIVALDPKSLPTLSGKTGNDACKTKNLSCAYILSTNYVSTSNGIDAPLYTPACASSYNKSLKGVKDGVGMSNIHSCDAKVGTYGTFELIQETSSIQCAANFIAICN